MGVTSENHDIDQTSFPPGSPVDEVASSSLPASRGFQYFLSSGLLLHLSPSQAYVTGMASASTSVSPRIPLLYFKLPHDYIKPTQTIQDNNTVSKLAVSILSEQPQFFFALCQNVFTDSGDRDVDIHYFLGKGEAFFHLLNVSNIGFCY